MIDYIIVGFGLGGSAMASHLESEGKSYCVIDSNAIKASVVAAGLYNPIVLKRYTMAWNADEQLSYAKRFYTNLEYQLGVKFIEELPVLRRFHSAEEQNNWFDKIDKHELSKYLSPYLVDKPTEMMSASFKYGRVMHTGRILVKKMLDSYSAVLKKKGAYLNEEFDYAALSIDSDKVVYKTIEAKHIVFCEGHALKNNPFFNKLPLIGNKGTYIIIESEKLKLKAAIKSHYFIVPLGANRYKFGATYEQQVKGDDYAAAAKAQLVSYLDDLILVPYKIIDEETGVRPTVKDRRPIIGQHYKHRNLYLLNGLGTRGVIIAPTMANYLCDFIEKKNPIPAEVNCNRFDY